MASNPPPSVPPADAVSVSRPAAVTPETGTSRTVDHIPGMLPEALRAFVTAEPVRVVYAVVFSRFALFLPNPSPAEAEHAQGLGFQSVPHRCGMILFPELS